MIIIDKVLETTTLFLEQSSYLIGQHKMRTKEMLYAIKGNPKVLLVTASLWAIPYAWLTTYLPLYMLKNGLTKMQIASVVTMNLIIQLIALITGGYLTDRLGRKKTFIIFDALGWAPALVLLLIADNMFLFSLFYIIFGIAWVVVPAESCLFIEGTKESDRPAIFAILFIVAVGAGLFMPIAGILIEVFQLVNGFRIICVISFFMVVFGLICRMKYIRETEIGNMLKQEKSKHSFKNDIKDYMQALKSIPKRKNILFFLLIQSFSFIISIIMMTYAPIFLSDPSGIGLSESSISLFPFIFSISIVLVALTVIPYLGREKIEKYLTFGSGFVLFGLIIFVLAPQKGIAFIGFSYFLLALGNAFFRPMSDTYGANVLQDRERAKVTTIFVFFYTAFSAIAVPLAGLLYKYFPQLPFIALVPIQLVIILLTLRLSPKT